MYDPQHEDIWESAIRAAQSVTQPLEKPFQSGRTAKSQGFRQAKDLIIAALREAQKESIARRYPLMK